MFALDIFQMEMLRKLHVALGAPPIKQGPRSKQAKQRDELKQLMDTSPTTMTDALAPGTSPPMATSDTVPHQLFAAKVDKQLQTDYYVH